MVRALRPDDFPAVEQLFGAKGACAGCWCMFWRLGEGERFEDVKGAEAKRRFRALVETGAARGMLAFAGGEAVGWLALGPRREFAKLDRAPSLACDDADRVTSFPCFFIRSDWRGQGVATALLERAVHDAVARGAEVLEGYPVKPPRPNEKIPAAFAYTGTVPLFERAGFTVEERRPKGRQRVRLVVARGRRSPSRKSRQGR